MAEYKVQPIKILYYEKITTPVAVLHLHDRCIYFLQKKGPS